MGIGKDASQKLTHVCMRQKSSRSHADRLQTYRSVNAPSVRISHGICKGLHEGWCEGCSKHPSAHAVGGMCWMGIGPNRGHSLRRVAGPAALLDDASVSF